MENTVEDVFVEQLQVADNSAAEDQDEFREITYNCTNCQATQTIRYFAQDPILSFTCCVTCRAGFGMEPSQQLANRVGMFPVGEV